MARVTVTDCLDHVDNRFQLVLVASKRVRQLILGAEPLVEVNKDKWTVVALREIAEGLIGPSILEEEEPTNELNFDENGEPIPNTRMADAEEASEESASAIPYEEVNLEQGTPEWKEWRKGGFGASDIPVLMRQTKKSMKALLAEKDNTDYDFQSEAMRLGLELEPEARKLYGEKVGDVFVPVCLQHKKYAWARASLDGISADRQRVVEIKCGKNVYEKSSKGEIPKEYHGQLQHILFVTGLESIDYWCYWPQSGEGILLTMQKDKHYIDTLIDVAEKHKHHLADETVADSAMATDDS